MIIKLLLVLAFLLIALGAARLDPSPRHLAVRRLVGGALAAAAVLAVLVPDLVTVAANTLGVGRGADLVLYVLVVVSTVVAMGLYRRILLLERRLTLVVRAQALAAPQQPVHAGNPPEHAGAEAE